jgi:hypothetical protein
MIHPVGLTIQERYEAVMEPGQFLKCPVLIMIAGQLWNVCKELNVK